MVRLANVLPQQPEAERYQGGELLLLEALQLDRRRFKAVCAAVRAQADAIPERSADFIGHVRKNDCLGGFQASIQLALLVDRDIGSRTTDLDKAPRAIAST